MITLFWALWDEDFGQRPWKSFQQEWKDRYLAFLTTSHSKSGDSQKDVEGGREYQTLKSNYDKLSEQTSPRQKEINDKLRDLSAKILAVQNVFTDRRAYVNAATYAIETETSASSKQRKEKNLEAYENEPSSVEMPDGKLQAFKT